MNSDILKRMRDELVSVDTDEARELVALYDAHDWFVTSTVKELSDASDQGDTE